MDILGLNSKRFFFCILEQFVTSDFCGKSDNTIFIFLKSAISSDFVLLSLAPSVAASIGPRMWAATANTRRQVAIGRKR